jgi:hypothetical protein
LALLGYLAALDRPAAFLPEDEGNNVPGAARYLLVVAFVRTLRYNRAMGVIQTVPAGVRAYHVLADYVFTRRCPTCGECTEKYIYGDLLRAEREAAWGPRSLSRMAREIGVPKQRLSEMERGKLREFDEDTARAYLSALGIL